MDTQDPYAQEPEVVLKNFDVDAANGLTSHQVRTQHNLHGPNEMPQSPGTPFWKLVLKQFEDLLVLILLGAAVVSLFLGLLEEDASLASAMIEPGVIMTILIANAIVGVYQESSAEEAINELKRYEANSAFVLRNGEWQEVLRSNLYPGDIVKVRMGDKIPADIRLIDLVSQTIRVNESTLTGESATVLKQIESIPHKAHVTDQEKLNILFSGTLVASGSAIGCVVFTGSNTSLGKIQQSLEEEDEQKNSPRREIGRIRRAAKQNHPRDMCHGVADEHWTFQRPRTRRFHERDDLLLKDCGRASSRRYSGGFTCCRYHLPRTRNDENGEAKRDCSQPSIGRDLGLHNNHLLR